jgi:hypothetical protein
LFALVDRDLESSASDDIAPDWQFAIAYNAALRLCTVVLYAEGYRPEKNLAHYRTLQALGEALGNEYAADVEYLQKCRVKRHEAQYDFVGTCSPQEARELQEYVKELRTTVETWLKKNHPSLLP